MGVADDSGPHLASLDALLDRARLGDEDAFAELFRELQPRVLRYLRMRCGDAWQDVASETWLRVIRDLHRFDGDAASFTAWLFTIARHRAVDAVRAARRRPQPTADYRDGPSHVDVAETVVGAFGLCELRSMLDQLPADQAEAVVLRHAAGLDIATVARLLGKSPTAVRVNSHRGLRRLAALFDPESSYASDRNHDQ